MNRTALLTLSLLLTLGACGPVGQETEAGPGGESGESTEVSSFGSEEITFGSSLAQIRGHHAVALELYSAGDRRQAAVHAGHPIEEIFTAVGGELTEHGEAGLAGELETALQEVEEAVRGGAPRADVRSTLDRASQLTLDAESAMVGDLADSGAYDASVIAALLSTAAHEYEEAVDGNSIALLVEYEDGFGFLTEARDMYAPLEPDVEAVSAEEAEEITDAFETLNEAFPSVEPPASPLAVEDVEVAAELIGHELEETVDAQVLVAAEPEEIGEEINALLDEVVEHYEEGEAAEASEYAAEAYLQNYEVIEADVIEHAPQVNAELEPLLGAELRRQIQQDAPVSKIESMVRRARRLLAEALRALEEES